VETLQKVSIVPYIIASEKDEAEKDNAKNGKKRENMPGSFSKYVLNFTCFKKI
jgi:hypothetical protein